MSESFARAASGGEAAGEEITRAVERGAVASEATGVALSEAALASLDNFREQQLRMENAWLRAALEAQRGRWTGGVRSDRHETRCGCDLCRIERAAA